ncbi:MAG TPA: hypothetical protein VF932_15750 [Anaerolineae bacterium]
MKTRQKWALAGLGVIILALSAYAAVQFVLQPTPVIFREKGKGLGKDQIISARAGARVYGVRKGDAFPFVLEVLYDSTQIAEIDRANLDKSVNLRPFEVRDFQDTEFAMDAHTRIFRREYTLQFIDGKVDQSYQLPTIVVRYRLKNTDGFAEKGALPDPIVVQSRLSEDISNLELRPITDKIVDPSRDRLMVVLWGGGGLIGVFAVAHLALRTIPQWRSQSKQRRRIAEEDVFIQAYRALDPQQVRRAEPKRVLYQIDHLLRLILAEKEKVGWLEEPNLESLPAAIRPSVTELLTKTQQSYSLNGTGPADIEIALNKLDTVLQFYFGPDEIKQWRT